jgi:site-specific recombinase XerD
MNEASEIANNSGDLESARNLKLASAHWLRHEMLTEIANNTDINIARDAAGHSNISTTNTYIHTRDHHRHKEVTRVIEKYRE